VLDQSRDISDSQWGAIVGEIDQNKDGKVSYEEFFQMMKKL
jgi:hypothetical protein